MKTLSHRWLLAALACLSLLTLVAVRGVTHAAPSPRDSPAYRPELAYLKVINQAGPAKDPQVVFLLMAQFANAGQQREGIEFFNGLTTQFGLRLSDREKALYLGATALLRAQYAKDVSVWERIGWVNDTVRMIDDAKRLTGAQAFVIRWISGVVRAQLPGWLGQRDAAVEELQWCIDHVEKAPHPGWLREVYHQLALIHKDRNDMQRAHDYLRLAGYTQFEQPVTLLTPYTEDPVSGHAFSSKRIKEIVPGKVFALSGYEFTEYYFIVSDNGRELLAIDAGTRPDSAKAAYEALRAHTPNLPPLTTVFVTHAHWDHVGGHRYFRSLESHPRFIARANYAHEISTDQFAPRSYLNHFFGQQFNMEDVSSFKPDVAIDRETTLNVGGTAVELIPVRGGETDDAMFIHLPNEKILFVGDFIMPYLGAPFVEEGNLDGLLDAIDIVSSKNPRHILHGHEPLTRMFDSVPMLTGMKHHLAWLKEQVLSAISAGTDRASLQQANLIPPDLPSGNPATHAPYLIMRENVINRLYDQYVGYWQPDMQGMDYISRKDRGAMLVDYLGLSERQLAKAAGRMVADGQHELAAQMLETVSERFPDSTELCEAKRLAYLKLQEKYQDISPFKFIVYSSRIGKPVPHIPTGK